MSVPVVRFGDVCTGHDCHPPRKNIQGSLNVFVNSRPVHRFGDAWDVHCCVLCHAGTAVGGSATVFVNGRPLFRVGDAIDCGSFGMQGSLNVFSG